MARPVLIAASDNAEDLVVIDNELTRRYGADYEVVSESSADSALAALERFERRDRQVAVVLADLRISGDRGPEVLSRAGALHPGAKRGLVIPWGDRSVAEVVRRGAALGEIDFWTLKPWQSPDEQFHAMVGEALREWSSATVPQLEIVRVVGQQWSPRSHEIRDLLARNTIPYGFYEASSERGRALLHDSNVTAEHLPVLVLLDGRTLVDPTNAELADALGVRTQPAEGEYDVVVIGAGPAGLAASVYGTSEGLGSALFEREAIGGQAGTTSLIRNYLGFPRGLSGQELAQRAYEQAWLFGTEFIYGNEAIALRQNGNRRIITLADGDEITTRAVVLATGVSYRRLGIPRLEALTGAGIFYGAAVTEAEAMSGQPVFVVGGGNSAGQAAVHLAKFAERVTLLVRGPSLADSMSDYLIRELNSEPNIEIRHQVEVVDGHGESRLEQLTLRDRESGRSETVPAAALFILIGAQPRTDWLPDQILRDHWGYLLTGNDLLGNGGLPERWPLQRPPMLLETSLPGVFAAGDVRHASVKRVASAAGEGAISIQMVHRYLAEHEDE